MNEQQQSDRRVRQTRRRRDPRKPMSRARLQRETAREWTEALEMIANDELDDVTGVHYSLSLAGCAATAR